MLQRSFLACMVLVLVSVSARGQYVYPSGGCTGGISFNANLAGGYPGPASFGFAPYQFAPQFQQQAQYGFPVPYGYGVSFPFGGAGGLYRQAFPGGYSPAQPYGRGFGGFTPYPPS